MNKIYVFPSHADPQGDCPYLAVAEDGEEVAGHVSSSPGWGKVDMGVAPKSTHKHDLYAKKYPDGYELEWVDDWKSHPVLSKLAEANKKAGA